MCLASHCASKVFPVVWLKSDMSHHCGWFFLARAVEGFRVSVTFGH